MLDILRRIEGHGCRETAHRTMQRIGRSAGSRLRTDKHDAYRRPACRARPEEGHAARSGHRPGAVARAADAIDAFQRTFVVGCTLHFAPHAFVRPGELRMAEWSEFDLDAAEWRIPAERMKMRAAHLLPLSTQAVAIVRELHPLTCSGRCVFPSLRTVMRPMSDNTINAVLRRIGYSGDEHVGHGFRAMSSTLLNELGWQPDVIERHLAHAPRKQGAGGLQPGAVSERPTPHDAGVVRPPRRTADLPERKGRTAQSSGLTLNLS